MDKDGARSSGLLENLLFPQAFVQRLYLIAKREHTGCSVASFPKIKKTPNVNVIAQDSISDALVLILLLNTNDSC